MRRYKNVRARVLLGLGIIPGIVLAMVVVRWVLAVNFGYSDPLVVKYSDPYSINPFGVSNTDTYYFNVWMWIDGFKALFDSIFDYVMSGYNEIRSIGNIRWDGIGAMFDLLSHLFNFVLAIFKMITFVPIMAFVYLLGIWPVESVNNFFGAVANIRLPVASGVASWCADNSWWDEFTYWLNHGFRNCDGMIENGICIGCPV